MIKQNKLFTLGLVLDWLKIGQISPYAGMKSLLLPFWPKIFLKIFQFMTFSQISKSKLHFKLKNELQTQPDQLLGAIKDQIAYVPQMRYVRPYNRGGGSQISSKWGLETSNWVKMHSLNPPLYKFDISTQKELNIQPEIALEKPPNCQNGREQPKPKSHFWGIFDPI